MPNGGFLFIPEKMSSTMKIKLIICLSALLFLLNSSSVISEITLSRYSYGYSSLTDISQVLKRNPNSSLLVLGYYYAPYYVDLGQGPTNELSNAASVALQTKSVTRIPLLYPNPVSAGGVGQMGYHLSTGMDIELRFYDMRGYEVFRLNFLKDTMGGMTGQNLVNVPINQYGLSSGPYFFLLINAGKVLSKGKFVVKP